MFSHLKAMLLRQTKRFIQNYRLEYFLKFVNVVHIADEITKTSLMPINKVYGGFSYIYHFTVLSETLNTSRILALVMIYPTVTYVPFTFQRLHFNAAIIYIWRSHKKGTGQPKSGASTRKEVSNHL